jgi:hypothetical protein
LERERSQDGTAGDHPRIEGAATFMAKQVIAMRTGFVDDISRVWKNGGKTLKELMFKR